MINEDVITIYQLLQTYHTERKVLIRLQTIRKMFALLTKPHVLMGTVTEQITFPAVIVRLIRDLRTSHLTHLNWFSTIRRAEGLCAEGGLSPESDAILRRALTECSSHDAAVLVEYYHLEDDMVAVEAELAAL